MADISACSGVIDKKDKSEITQKCPLRHGCRRYNTHLNATSEKVSYIKAAFIGQSCEFLKE